MAREHRPRRNDDGSWEYPVSADVLEECGLQTMEAYIRRRRSAIAEHLVTQPLYHACRASETMTGSPHHDTWWQQEFNLDA